jgi:hypothetical protein
MPLHPAAGAERGIEATVGIVAGQCRGAVVLAERLTRGDGFRVRLDLLSGSRRR